MDFDFAAEGPKLIQLLYGLLAFVAVIGCLLLVLDVLPTWIAALRERARIREETAKADATEAEAPPVGGPVATGKAPATATLARPYSCY